jgi:translation initiation factor 2 subunit 3
MANSPEVSIALVGHVDHGKTSLLKKLSGVWTDTHSEEMKRGITIKLGYANVSFYKDKNGYTTEKTKDAKLVRTVSFVDAPGHETLMATMLSGAAIVDGALLLVAANEECPQPQTREHLMALDITGIKNIVIVQNKIDLVDEKQALKNYNQIKEFVKGTIAENAPIVPVSAQHGANIPELIEAIEETIKTPKRDFKKDPVFFVARSFDVNKPGIDVKDISGGVIGGAVEEGKFKIGDKIEINPGFNKGDKYIQIVTEIKGIMSGKDKIDEAIPGGSIALLTGLDPSVVKSDALSGNLVTLEGKSPELFHRFKLKPELLKRVIGSKEDLKVDPIKKGEILMLNVNSATTVGDVANISKNEIEATLRIPVAARFTDRITISRRIGTRWRLIGVADIVK